MKLHLESNDKLNLVIFFCGFSQNPDAFLDVINADCDVLYVYDYSVLDFCVFDEFDFSLYTEINLIAYSYGVFAANISAGHLPYFNQAAALCGTIFPIDENYGIKPKIYDLMLNSFNKDVLINFEAKMQTNCTGKMKSSSRSIENLHSELKNIKKYVSTNKISANFQFDKAFITKKDKIISYNAQKNYWSGKCRIIELECGHFPFFLFNNVTEILEY